jgi:hypothetical protein
MKKWILVLATLATVSSMACDFHGKTGITIDNDLWIGPHDKNAAGITKEDFDKAIDDVEALYTDIVASAGGTLKVVRNWDDGTVNAFARQTGGTWEVHMFGGLARHETVTPDGFALVVCHELGHHLGGAPRKLDWFGQIRWAANEGQADYWGVSKCFRKLLEGRGDSLTVVNKMDVDPEVQKTCDAQFGTSPEQTAICVRSAYAGRSLASLFHSLRGLSEDLSFSVKDPAEVEKTYHGHPMPQCRMDTYFAASACDIASHIDTDMDDPTIGTCNRTDGFQKGLRPLCWYNPSEYNN